MRIKKVYIKIIVCVNILLTLISVAGYTLFQDMGDGFFYDVDNMWVHHIKKGTIIPGKVANYASNKEYLVILQKPGDKEIESFNIRSNTNFRDLDLDSTYVNGRDSLYYWILNKKNFERYGPLSKSNFEQKSSELQLKIPKDFHRIVYH